MRDLTTTLTNILSLISCAQDYGFEDDILFVAFAKILDNKLTNEEINTYAGSVFQKEGYTSEDYDNVKDILINFKNKYIL